MIRNIDPATAKKWLENNEACIIDVREPYENKERSIKNSILVPLNSIDQEKIPEEFKNKKIIIHCQKGGRATKACEKILSQNPNFDLYNLEGGIINWVNCGNEVECKSINKMSIERQVRLSIGTIIFIGSIFTVFIDEKFIFIPTFFGFALAFTAIINWCGMAKFLALMPWNK